MNIENALGDDVTTEESNRRLLATARFLRKLPPDRFYFGAWVGADWEGEQDLSCGTTACVMGWVPQVPELKHFGLRILREGWIGIGFPGEEGDLSHIDFTLRTARKIFGLTYTQAHYLFIPESQGFPESQGCDDEFLDKSPDVHASAKEVAGHIERFVATRK